MASGCSDVLATNAGVPQGSILSPTLFLLHINDLLTVTSNPIFSFADDTTVIASFSSHRPISAQETQDPRRYFTSQQLLVLYRAQIRPPLEYCSHIWSSAPKHTLNMLDSVQRRAIRLISNPALTCSLQSLEHRRTVADLSLFYRYYHGRCSAQLAAVIPPGAIFGRHTRQANKAHPYVVKLDTPRTSLHQSSFFYRTAVRWNSLPARIFPSSYDLQAFKRGGLTVICQVPTSPLG